MTTIGPDFASVDHNDPIDFTAVKQAGARFAIARAVYGRSVTKGSTSPFLDPVWAQNKDKIDAASLRRGAYLFVCYEQNEGYTPPPEEQADAFISYVTLTPFRDLVPIFDVEQASNKLTANEMYLWTLRVAKRLRDYYGAWPMMYTSARVWAENLDHHSPGPLLHCPLWLAKPWPWAVRTPVHLDGAPSYSPTTIPEWGSQYFIYQYQGDALQWPGFSSTCDANRARVFAKGVRGAHVTWTQQRLAITADGIFGDKTEAAVKSFQQKHGLSPDGVVGLNTFTMLSWENPAPL